MKVPSFREMIEMFEVMSELEGRFARQAARRINDQQLIAQEQSNIECEDAIKAKGSDLYY